MKRSQRVAIYVRFGCDLLLFVGFFGAALGWRPGGFLMLTGIAGRFVSHLFIGLTAYRDAMSRPWPPVQPLVEDDDEW